MYSFIIILLLLLTTLLVVAADGLSLGLSRKHRIGGGGRKTDPIRREIPSFDFCLRNAHWHIATYGISASYRRWLFLLCPSRDVVGMLSGRHRTRIVPER